MCADWGTGSMGERSDSQMVYSPQRRRDAETSAEILGTDGPVVEGNGQARECDFDAEARRRGDKRGETAQSKRGRARRQRRMVAFGVERTGFRRDPRHVRRKPGA